MSIVTRNLCYIILTICFINSYAYNKNLSNIIVNNKTIEEMSKIMRQHINCDSLWHCNLTYEMAMEFGISDSLYFSYKNQLNEMNKLILEQRKKGVEIHLNEEEMSIYKTKEGYIPGDIIVK